MDAGALLDAFALLGLDLEATEAQIRTAYRKRSLQLHPDKVKDVPADVAAERFHQLTVAYEQLLDPATRANLAQKLEQERALRARHAEFDSRRREMAADLEMREQLDRQAKARRAQHAREREQRIAALREEGRAMRIDKHERLLKEWQTRAQAVPQKRKAADDVPPLGPMDTTVLVRFPTEQWDEMGADALLSDALNTPLGTALATYGALTSVVVRPPKKRREVSALATFADIVPAWRAVQEGHTLRCTPALLEGTWIGWAEPNFKERTTEPARIAYLARQPSAAPDAPPEPETDVGPGLLDAEYEAHTLARLQRAAVQGAA